MTCFFCSAKADCTFEAKMGAATDNGRIVFTEFTICLCRDCIKDMQHLYNRAGHVSMDQFVKGPPWEDETKIDDPPWVTHAVDCQCDSCKASVEAIAKKGREVI